MSIGKLQLFDILIIGGYLIACLIIGLYKSTKIKGIKDYAIGNQNFPTFVIISTIFATFMSANQIIGKTEQIYKLGLVFGAAILFIPLNWLIVKNIYAKNINRFDGCISMSEIMEKLYGNCGSIISSIIIIITAIGILSIQVTAVAYLFQYFLNLSYTQGVIIGVGILTIYSALGGVRAVALTDVFQFFIFFLILPIACGYAYFKAGGYENIITSLPESHFTLYHNGSLSLFLSYVFFIATPAIHAPYAQRLLMAKNKKQLTDSYNILIVTSLFFACIVFTLGFCIRAIYPDIEAKMALYHFVGDLPPIFIGIMIVGILAVIMSTADSWLNSLSVVISHDILKKIYPKIDGKTELLTARISTFLCALLAIIISLSSGAIFKLIIFFQAFYYATILVPFTAGFLKFKTNNKSFLASVLCGIICTVITKYYTGEFGVKSLTFGVIGSAIALLGAHYLQIKIGRIKQETSLHLDSKLPFKTKIKQFLNNFLNIKKNVQNSKLTYYIFGLFSMGLNIPLLILGFSSFNDVINSIAQTLHFANLLLAILLISYEFFTKEKYPVFLWNIVLFFALPLTGLYFFIASNFDPIWGINCFISIIALFLLTNSYHALIFTTISIILVTIFFKFTSMYKLYLPQLNPNINNTFLSTYSTLLLCIVIIYIVFQKFREDKVKQYALEILARSIAHDVTTPLSIGLLEVKLIKHALKLKDFSKIEDHIDNLEKSNIKAMQDIDIMLSATKIQSNDLPSDWGQYSLIQCINESLNEYKMTEEQKDRISFLNHKENAKDFIFTGSNTLLKHILFNLIKNAFKYAGSTAKIKLFIKNNNLHIKDNGHGLNNDIINHLFERYITTHGYGIGLNFCKQAMIKMNGDIKYNANFTNGTEFILIFNQE